MGSRLRASPERILECFLEVAAPTDGQEPKIEFVHPTDFEDKEALKAIPRFCYPCVSNTEAVQSYTFVLTDIEGKYRFGFCRYSPNVRTCLCILSYLPWFETFYVVLNTLSELQKGDEKDVVPHLLNSMLNKKPPKPGSQFTVKPESIDKEYTFKAPDTNKLPCIPENRNLTEYFAAIQPANMIALFASMFFERRIIVTSKRLSLLTACTYGAARLLYPMHWQHMFVPIVPPHLLDYCCAPMPFLVGVHSSLMPRVRQMPLDEVVILDADNNQLESVLDDVANMPSDAGHTLKSALKKTSYPIDDHVSRAFLAAMVCLVGGYRDALRFKAGEKIVFDRDAFLQNKASHKEAFLAQVLQLQLFEQFIGERLELLNSGQGFNDAFEEQIGVHAENHTKLKSQYQMWKKSGGAFFAAVSEQAQKKGKKGFKEAKNKFKDVKSILKETANNIKDKFQDKDSSEEEEAIGGPIKKSNTLPDIKQLAIRKSPLSSPFGTRRAVSPGQPRRAKTENSKLKPNRPPPPLRPNLYASKIRRRTNAISMVEGKDPLTPPPLQDRRSAPELNTMLDSERDEGGERTGLGKLNRSGEGGETATVATLISLDTSEEDVRDEKPPSQSCLEGNTLLQLSSNIKEELSSGTISQLAATSHESKEDATSGETDSYKTPVVPYRRRSSSKRLSDASGAKVLSQSPTGSKGKPPIPPRPDRDSFKHRTTSDLSTSSVISVDEILESVRSPVTPSGGLVSPLKPANTASLWTDTVSSLSPDLQEFFNTNSTRSCDPWSSTGNHGAPASHSTWTANFDSGNESLNNETVNVGFGESENRSSSRNPFDQLIGTSRDLRISNHPTESTNNSQSLLD